MTCEISAGPSGSCIVLRFVFFEMLMSGDGCWICIGLGRNLSRNLNENSHQSPREAGRLSRCSGGWGGSCGTVASGITLADRSRRALTSVILLNLKGITFIIHRHLHVSVSLNNNSSVSGDNLNHTRQRQAEGSRWDWRTRRSLGYRIAAPRGHWALFFRLETASVRCLSDWRFIRRAWVRIPAKG